MEEKAAKEGIVYTRELLKTLEILKMYVNNLIKITLIKNSN